MGCACRKNAVATPNGATGSIKGFNYIPPGGGTPISFMTVLEARAEQRRQGGGTIKTIRAK